MHAPHQHPVFAQFRPWRGEVEPGYEANFLGVMTDARFDHRRMQPATARRHVRTACPELNSEYFEWISVLEAVVAAKEQFVMAELGAGWAPWLVSAAAAMRQTRGLPCLLIGVEAEPTHYAWMHEHFRTNGLDPAEHRLVRAAIGTDTAGSWFLSGDPADSYAQRSLAVRGLADAWRLKRRALTHALRSLVGFGKKKQVIRVPSITLAALFNGLPPVDLIHMDVQGVEYEVLKDAGPLLAAGVRRMAIATHTPEAEAGLRRLFRDLGWRNVFDFPRGGRAETPWGSVSFDYVSEDGPGADGLQTWDNPALVCDGF